MIFSHHQKIKKQKSVDFMRMPDRRRKDRKDAFSACFEKQLNADFTRIRDHKDAHLTNDMCSELLIF